MIKHIVMWKLKKNALGNERSENARLMKLKLEELKGIIDEIKTIEVGINITPSPSSFDIVLVSEFETEKDLEIYQNHPEHKRVGEFVSEINEGRAMADYEF